MRDSLLTLHRLVPWDMTCTWRKHSNSSPYLLGRHITVRVWRGREREKEREKVGKKTRNNKKGQQAPEWGQADTMCRPVLSQEAAEAECVWVDDRWRELSPRKGVRSSGPCTFMDSNGLRCQSLTWRAGGLVYTSPPECCYLLMDNILNTSISLISFKETFMGTK